MGRLTKEDLEQMNKTYFQSLDQETLVKVACNLLELGIDLVERLEQNSRNSSRPPSSDNPYDKKKKGDTTQKGSDNAQEDEEKSSSQDEQNNNLAQSQGLKRSPGRQPGSKGFGRSVIPVYEEIIPHYPNNCSACDAGLTISQGQRSVYGILRI